MRKGKVYLLVEKRGANKVAVTGHRTSPPDQWAVPGVWVGVNLSVPDSVFVPFEASLELPEQVVDALITVTPRVEPEVENEVEPDAVR